MFKKINLLMLFVLSLMAAMPAYSAECSPNSVILLTNGQDTVSYRYKSDSVQNILTSQLGYQIWEYHTNCLLVPSDFQKGDTNKGSAVMPSNAKVTRMTLDGYNNGGITTKIYVSTYIKNSNLTAIPAQTSGYKDYADIDSLGDGFKYTDNKACQFPDNTSATNPLTLLDLPFAKPFIYTGGNATLVLDMWYDNDPMNFYYNTVKAAEHATVIRSGHFATGNFTTLPAVNIDYFTNDVRGKFTDLTGAPIVENVSGKTVDETGPYVRLVDNTDGSVVGLVHPAADGSFAFINLNPYHKYHLSAFSYSYGYIEKDVEFTAKNGSLDYADDIIATIKMEKSEIYTGVNGVNSNHGLTVLGAKSSITVVADRSANVAVYDVTGRLVRQASVEAGSNSIDGLVPGIYIVNHVKVAVK